MRSSRTEHSLDPHSTLSHNKQDQSRSQLLSPDARLATCLVQGVFQGLRRDRPHGGELWRQSSLDALPTIALRTDLCHKPWTHLGPCAQCAVTNAH